MAQALGAGGVESGDADGEGGVTYLISKLSRAPLIMISKTRFAAMMLFLYCFGHCALGQVIYSQYHMTTCTQIGHCKQGLDGVSKTEQEILTAVLRSINKDSTRQSLSEKYEHIPGSDTSPIQAAGQPVGTYVSKGAWYIAPVRQDGSAVTGQEKMRLDVYFTNNKVIAFRLWLVNLSKSVDIDFD